MAIRDAPDRSQGPHFLCLTGPTTSGKTALSLTVAKRLGAEVISMDSRQVYRGMDVGTDKVGLRDRAKVPHHGLDLIDPSERYSAGKFARDAREWIVGIRSRGRVPLLAGGTGFFLRALTEPIFREPHMDGVRLRRLRAVLDDTPVDRLSHWVGRLDPERAQVARAGGRQRLARTVEVALMTGRSLSWWHRNSDAEGPPLSGITVILDLPRSRLDANIQARARRMVEQGLVGEVRRLLDAGFTEDAPGMTGTGYREVAAHILGRMALDDALDEMTTRTRQYSRRQLTWFRGQLPAEPRVDATCSVRAQADQVVGLWRRATAKGTAG